MGTRSDAPPRGPRGTALVLGASGFLGPHVVAALADAGWSPVAAGRRGGELPGGAPVLAGDLARDGAAERLLERAAPAVVVLAAALSRVDSCEREPELARLLNARVPGLLAAACAERGARLVSVSTDLVFGGRPPAAGERYREEDPPSPVHAYGSSKALGEEAALAAGGDVLVVRLPLLYGDSHGRGLGATDGLLAALAAGRDPVLFRDEWRTPLEVRNAARALAELAGRRETGLLHVAGPDRVTRAELGRAAVARLGASRGLAGRAPREGTRAGAGMRDRPADTSLDAARARGLLSTELLGVAAGLAACAG